MDKIIEAIEFIESKTMRKYLNGLYASGNLSLSNEDMLAIVWNMKGDIDMKQAFLMSFTDDDRAGKCAVELVKRIEAFRSFIKENPFFVKNKKCSLCCFWVYNLWLIKIVHLNFIPTILISQK